jgi:hypothetical protein
MKVSLTGALLFLLCFAAALVRLIVLVRDFGVELLYRDQIAFYDVYFNDLSLAQIFLWQHGQHRLGLGGVVQKFILEPTRWSNLAVSYAIVAVLVLALVSALWFKLRVTKRLEPVDAVLPLLFLTSNQYETILAAPSLAPAAFPLLLTFLYPLAWTAKAATVRYGATAILLPLTIFTGYGYVAGLGVAAVLGVAFLRAIWKRDRSELIGSSACLLIAALSYAAFFYHLRWTAGGPCFTFPHWPLRDYLYVVALMPVKFIGLGYLRFQTVALAAGLILLGVIGCILVLNLIRYWRSGSTVNLALACLILSPLGFDALATIGRICIGLHASGAPRYVTFMIPLFTAIFFHFAFAANRRSTALAALVGVAALGGFLPPRLSQRDSLVDLVRFQRAWRQCYLETENVDGCSQKFGPVFREDPRHARLDEKLQWLKARGLNMYIDRAP